MEDKNINNIEETQSEKAKKPKSKSMKILDVIIPVACLVVALCSGYYLYSVNHEYDVAVDEYKELEVIAGIEEYPETMDVETEDVLDMIANGEAELDKLLTKDDVDGMVVD